MASRPAGVLRLGRRSFGASQLLVMAVVSAEDPAGALERVHAAVAERADIVEVAGRPDGEVDEREEIRRSVPFIATVRDIYPELVVGVSTGRREVAREACAAGADLLSWAVPGPGALWDLGLAEVAADCGAGVVCPPALAARAVAAGVAPERVVVGVEGATRAGRPGGRRVAGAGLAPGGRPGRGPGHGGGRRVAGRTGVPRSLDA